MTDIGQQIGNSSKRLFDALNKIENTPVRLTLAEFKQFEPLFRSDSVDKYTDEQLSELGNLYMRTIDLYRPVNIIKSKIDPTVVLVLPPIFTSAKSMDNTPENDKLVDININMSKSDIPKYSETATKGMSEAFIKAQVGVAPLVVRTRAIYKQTMDVFNTLYHKEVVKVDTTQEVSDCDWDID